MPALCATRPCQAAVAAVAACAVGCTGAAKPDRSAVLVFTRTAGYRHDSIPAGIAAFRDLAAQAGYPFVASEDPSALDESSLANLRTVVFLNTTGTVLGDAQRSAFERWFRAGGGFVGVHSAADTEYDWPFYGELLGTYFSNHPATQSATIDVVDRASAITSALPALWNRVDEWYDFRGQPSGARVLARVDESTYSGGMMGPNHPIVWTHAVDSGRAVYVGCGHTPESYDEPLFRSVLLGSLRFASGDAD